MMPLKSGNTLYRPLAEINVTPLVDVMLVLLIIFMVTAPMMASGMKVNLPQAKQVQTLDPKAPIIVTVGKDSSLRLGSDIVERDKLISTIQQKLGTNTSQIIHLQGDKEAAYGDVVAVLDLLATNGLTHIAIVTDPHSKIDTALKSGSVKADVPAQASADGKIARSPTTNAPVTSVSSDASVGPMPTNTAVGLSAPAASNTPRP